MWPAIRFSSGVLVLTVASVSCRKTASPRSGSDSAGSVQQELREASPHVRFASSVPVFSAPIAALRVRDATVVAGLVAVSGIVRVMALHDDGSSWTSDVLSGVAWSPDADVQLEHARDGVALVWRGGKGEKRVGRLVLLGPDGTIRGAVREVAGQWCTTGERVAWIAPNLRGPIHVLSRTWSDDTPREAVLDTSDKTAALVCGDHDVFVLGDGDDGLTSTTFDPDTGVPTAPTVVIRDSDLGGDELEHRVFTSGDTLEIVHIASAGAIAARDVRRVGSPSAWRKLKYALSPDDDVVAVDGDEKTMVIVFTRPSEGTCPAMASTAERVEALWVDRAAAVETLFELAPADCQRSVGPFWTAQPTRRPPMIAWVERRVDPAPGAPPIAGVAYRTTLAEGVRTGRLEVAADAIADAGCDETECFVAALVRGPDGDGTKPLSIAVLGYP